MAATVQYGWVIQDKAAVLPGMGFGPELLRGKQRCGPLVGRYQNLLFKDVVFRGKGKHALGAIYDQMKQMPHIRIRAGIQEGMTIEKFVESEFGGGMDQVTVVAGREDRVRIPYYMYIYPYEKSDFSFDGMLMSTVQRVVGFGNELLGLGGGLASELVGAAKDMLDVGMTQFGGRGSDLQRALKSENVILLLTSKKRESRQQISVHKGSHSLASLTEDIRQAVLHRR